MGSSTQRLMDLERELAGVLRLSELPEHVLKGVRCVLDASGIAVFNFDAAGAPRLRALASRVARLRAGGRI